MNLTQSGSPTKELSVLHELFASATHEASSSMCRWTDGLITLSLDEVKSVPLREAADLLEMDDNVATMVVVSLIGLRGGEIILTFDEVNGRALVASLLRTPPPMEEEWTALEESALMETGNILACAYANALTRLIGSEMLPSAPTLLHDYTASVFEQAAITQAIDNDAIVCCRTIFHSEGKELNWRVLFIPTQDLQRAVEDAIHISF